MSVLKPSLVCDVGAEHAEGPVWHEAGQRLDWADIGAGCFHRFDPATGRDSVIAIGEPLGSFAPRRGGGYVLAVERGFAFLDLDTRTSELVVALDECGPGGLARMNDGKCDPAGRFWAGSMSYRLDEPNGALYRLDGDLTVTRMLAGVTISNGLGWAADRLRRHSRRNAGPVSHQRHLRRAGASPPGSCPDTALSGTVAPPPRYGGCVRPLPPHR